MKKILVLISLLAFSAFAAASDNQTTEIPLDDFIKTAEFVSVKISPKGDKLAGIVDDNGSHKIAVIDLKKMKPLSAIEFGENRKISRYGWTDDNHLLLDINKTVGFLDRKGKWEAMFYMDAKGKKKKELFNRGNSNGARIVDTLPEDPRHAIIITSNQGNNMPRLVTYDLRTGKEKKFSKPADIYADLPSLNSEKKPVVALAYNPKLASTYLYYKLPDEPSTAWKKLDLAEGKEEVTTRYGGPSKNPEEVYILSNHDAPTLGLFKLNLRSGELNKVYRHPVVDIEQPVYNLNDEVIGYWLNPDYPQIYWIKKNDPTAKIYQGLMQVFPGRRITVYNHTNDGKQLVFHASGDKYPGDFYRLDLGTNKIAKLVSARGWLNPKQLAEVKPITLKARDGLELHGYLTLPPGKEAKDLPLVVNPHGGPHGPRDYWGFNPEAQLLANRGYAVLQVNFRGSGGYGREFQQAGYRKWGREMQDDVTDATLWAVDQGIADKDRICLYGGSYGGYATLQGLVREPELYKCGIGYVGVYDLETMRACGDIVSRGHYGKTFLNKVIGKDEAELKANSPAQNADRIKAKVFLAHGEDDVRVPMCQLKQMVKGLKKAGKVEGKDYFVMTRDEGHGYHNPKNRKDFYSQALKFLDENIGDKANK